MFLCVDRENIKEEFETVFSNFISEQKNLMYLTGIPGIGKSVLIEYIHRRVKEEFKDVLNVFVNFNLSGTYFSYFDYAYTQLKQQGVKFYSYELARLYLFQLTGDEKYKISDDQSDLLNTLAALPLEFIEEPLIKVIVSGGINIISRLFYKLNDRYKNYLLQQSNEIVDSKHEDVIRNLGKYLICDINTYCEENNCNICYFIDTFEKCKDKTGFSEDEFIRCFVVPSKYSFWLISGTSATVFNKFRNKFDYFSCTAVEKFDNKKYVEKILKEQYDITDIGAVELIYNLSKGYPASVELIAQTYIELKDTTGMVSFDELTTEIDCSDYYNNFFERYYRRHVVGDDIYDLAFLACFDSWSYKEYEYYSTINCISNPRIKFEKLRQYVIVKENLDGSYFIIDVAKKCLLNADKFATSSIYKQAFDFLCTEIDRKSDEKINDKNSEKIHSQVISAIRIGATIIAEQPLFAKDFYDWFIKFEQSLSPKMLYELKEKAIVCFMNEVQQFHMHSKKDDIHSNCFLQCLYDYAWTFCYQRNYTKALEIIERYETFAKRIIKNGVDERIIKSQYTKAVILENQGEYEDSLKLHKEILEIRRKSANKSVIGVSLNCIGYLFMQMNDFANAKECFDESLSYRSVENDLRGFCTVHANLSKMYFLQTLYTNDSSFLIKAKCELDIALNHLPKKSYPALFESWEIRYSILRAQMLRYSLKCDAESYSKILSALANYFNIIKDNPQFGMQTHIMTTENNIAVILALMGDNKAYSLMKKCLSAKEFFYDINTNPKSKPCSITRKNLIAIEEGRLQNLVFEY